MSEVRLEDLVGRRIVDGQGRTVGHVEEVEAEWSGAELVVTRYLIGVSGLVARLSGEVWRPRTRGLGPSYAARWHQLDISNPRQPRLTCRLGKLGPAARKPVRGRRLKRSARVCCRAKQGRGIFDRFFGVRKPYLAPNRPERFRGRNPLFDRLHAVAAAGATNI